MSTRDELDLGEGHTLTFADYKDARRVGCSIAHKKPDGTDCEGWVAFEGRAWANGFAPGAIATWAVLSEEPLTLSPSVLCRACGDHGFVRDGKWVRA